MKIEHFFMVPSTLDTVPSSSAPISPSPSPSYFSSSSLSLSLSLLDVSILSTTDLIKWNSNQSQSSSLVLLALLVMFHKQEEYCGEFVAALGHDVACNTKDGECDFELVIPTEAQ